MLIPLLFTGPHYRRDGDEAPTANPKNRAYIDVGATLARAPVRLCI